MPKKKPLEIPKEFVEQVLGLIADESEQGRKKIVDIARRAEARYESPVKSWVTGWFYKYTRIRGDGVEQSINVMENFPDAYTRLQEFKLMVSEGKWTNSSYNYLLFVELIDAVPDYEPLEEQLVHSFVLKLKELVIDQINAFMAQYKITLEDIKRREIERQTMCQSERQVIENALVFNNLAAAKEAQSTEQDKTVFSLSFKDEQWHLTWVDITGQTYPLTLSDELAQKLATLQDQNIEKLSSVTLRRIKRECLKAREQYLIKTQVCINPEATTSHTALTNEELVTKGVTSTFVLRHSPSETSLWWINSLGFPNKISLTNYPILDSWLAIHKDPFNEEDVLQLKAHLLQVKTAQSFSSSKLESMNVMLSKVLSKQEKHRSADVEKISVLPHGKLDLSLFGAVKQHMEDRVKRIASVPPTPVSTPDPVAKQNAQQKTHKKLGQERYAALSELPTFWQQRRVAEEKQSVINEPSKLGNS